MFQRNRQCASVSKVGSRFGFAGILLAILCGAQEASAVLSVHDSLNRYSLYGRKVVDIMYGASTSKGGWIGSDSLVRIQASDTIRSTVTSGKDFRLENGGGWVWGDVRVARDMGSSSMYVDSVSGKTYVGRNLTMAHQNVLKNAVHVGGTLTTAAWNHNYFNGSDFWNNSASTVFNSPTVVPGLTWGVRPEATPYSAWDFPDTTFTTTAIKITSNFLTPKDASGKFRWTCGSNSLAGGTDLVALNICKANDTILPPGSYGDMDLWYGSTLFLGEGAYTFNNVTLNPGSGADSTRLLAVQPNSARTVMMIKGTLNASASSRMSVIAPELYYKGYGTDSAHFAGGTMMIYAEKPVTLGVSLELWATLVVPDHKVTLMDRVHLFGQILADSIYVLNAFKGADGAFIPYFPNRPKVNFSSALSTTVTEKDLLADKVTPDTSWAVLTVTMDHINGSPVYIYYHTVDNPAQSTGSTGLGSKDYVPVTNGRLVIPATELSGTILIPVLGDAVYEGIESFRIKLDSCQNADIGVADTAKVAADSFGVVIINDNDNALKVRLVPDGVTKMERPWLGDSAFHFRLETIDPLTGKLVPTKVPVTVKVRLVPLQNVVPASDYLLTTLHYTFKVNDSVVPLRVTIPKSDLFGPDKIFQLVIDSIYGAAKSDSIVNDTLTSPAVKLVVGNASANQATGTSLSLPVELVRVADGVAIKSSVALPFTWQTLDSTAKAGVHFTGVPAGTAGTFPANTANTTVSVSLIKNLLVDSARAFKAILTPSVYTGLSAAKDTGVGTILNGWPKPAILMTDVTVARKSSDFVVKVPVSLSQAATFASSYSFASANGGAVNGVDFALTTGTRSIASVDSIPVTIKASTQLDSTRHFYVIITSWDLTKLSPTPTSDTVAMVTLTNAISGARVLVDSAAANQSTSGTIRFPVRLVDALGNALVSRIPVPYSFSTIDGSAKGGVHFAAASGKLDTIAAGSSVDTFPIALIPTAKYDTTRHFLVDVAPVSGLGGLSNVHDSAVGTIANGFAKPTIHVDSASIVRPKVKTALPFKVWLDRASAIDLPFTWSTRNGSAVADTDFVGVTATGATVRDSTFLPVSIFARPGEYDTTRHFHVDLAGLAAFANASATNLGAILPSLGQPFLAVLPASVMEGPNGKDTSMVFKIELRDSTGAAMTTRVGATFTWTTQDSVATRALVGAADSIARTLPYASVFPADYVAVPAGVAAIAAGTGSTSVVVTVKGNDYKQFDRVLSILLQTATAARLGTVKTGLGTILDDDSSSTRAYFPIAKASVPESLSVAWVPVRLLPLAVVTDKLEVSVDPLSTAMRGVNFELLQPGAAFQRDTLVTPGLGAKTTSVTLDVAIGDTLLWVPVAIKRDSVRTLDLRILLNLKALTSFGLKVDPGRAQTELVLVNTDPAPYLGFHDTVLHVVRGQAVRLPVGIRPLPSEKDPSAQYTGAVTDTSGATAAVWSGFVATAKEGATPGFVQHRLDTSMAFATVNDGRAGPSLRAVLRLHDWTPGEALKPLADDTILTDSVVVWIDNTNLDSKVSFAQKVLTVKDVDGQAAIKLLLDRASWWNTETSVKGTGIPADVLLTADSSVVLHFAPGDSVATFVLRFGNDHKVGASREFDLHLASFVHLTPGADSVLHIVITNTNSGPKVKITSPSEGAALGKKDLDAAGKVPVAWVVDGKVQTPYDTLLPEGKSTITKCFADEWGNVGCDSIHVSLDTTAPVVIIKAISKDSGKTWIAVSPNDTPVVNKPGILVQWISIDQGDTIKHQDSETLKSDFNPVTRCVEDAVGNQGCTTRVVELDTIPPKVWIVTPPYGSHWQAGCIQTLWFEQDGDKITRHDTLYCFKNVGPATITVSSAPDRAGNVGTASTLVYIDPNSPTVATYVDTDGDGKIDAVVLQFPRPWTDSMPTFDISYGGPGANSQGGLTASYGTSAQLGTVQVINGETVRVVAGTPVLDASGQQVLNADGTPRYQSAVGTPLLDSTGKQVTNAQGVPLWKIDATSTAIDSSVLVVKLDTPFPYGWTSSTLTNLGVLHASVSTVDTAGKVVKNSWTDTFAIKDGVAPVILESRIIRTESYTGKDTLIVQLSEAANIAKSSGTGILEISLDGGLTWIPVDADTVTASGSIRVLLEPGQPGSPKPGVLIRIAGNISDASGNQANSSTSPAVVVLGAARPDLLEVKSPSTLFEVPSNWSSRPLKGGFTYLASDRDSDIPSAYVPGEGYASSSVTQTICPDLSLCAATNIYVNRPSTVQMFVYDQVGTYVAKTGFTITKDDLAKIKKDKLDRAKLQILWNLRDESGRQVISGVYLIRMVIRYTDDVTVGGKLDNFILRYGVKIR